MTLKLEYDGTELHRCNFIVVSSFTRDTPYAVEVERLKDSCDKSLTPYLIYSQANTGNWMENCRNTIKALAHTLISHPYRNILWIDADAEILSYPKYFESFEGQIGAHKRVNPNGDGFHWNTGTVFYRNDAQIVNQLLRQEGIVKTFYQGGTFFCEDINYLLANAEKLGLDLQPFPTEYSYIFDTKQPEELAVEPVIVHYQASRRLKSSLEIKP